MIGAPTLLWLAATLPAQPIGSAPVTALYAAVNADDEAAFVAAVDKRFGFFAAPDFIIPMNFNDFKDFAKMCVSPEIKSSSTKTLKKHTLLTVKVQALCKNPKTSESASRGFEFWVVKNKVIAIRPEGMR